MTFILLIKIKVYLLTLTDGWWMKEHNGVESSWTEESENKNINEKLIFNKIFYGKKLIIPFYIKLYKSKNFLIF